MVLVVLLMKKNVLGASLVAQFKTPIQVESDLLAAARGLFKCEAGIACILGTGSNSWFYNGKIIVKTSELVGIYWVMKAVGSAGQAFSFRRIKRFSTQRYYGRFL